MVKEDVAAELACHPVLCSAELWFSICLWETWALSSLGLWAWVHITMGSHCHGNHSHSFLPQCLCPEPPMLCWKKGDAFRSLQGCSAGFLNYSLLPQAAQCTSLVSWLSYLPSKDEPRWNPRSTVMKSWHMGECTRPWDQGRTGGTIHPGSNGELLPLSIQLSPIQLLTQHLAQRKAQVSRVAVSVDRRTTEIWK